MFVNFNILNQLGSPAINSNTFANRPAAGQTGRLFVSTDTFEIYRDNGTTWDLIGGPGTSTITGSGTATQVAYFTSSQAIGSSANLFWDNTNTRLGVGTATPGYTIEANGAIKADRVYLAGATAGNGALYWTSDRVTIANYNAGGIVHIETNGGAAAAIFGSDYTGTFTSGIGTRGYTGSTSYGALFNGSVGINTATPGAALDVHSTGTIAQFNTTSATGNTYIAWQRTGTGLWRLGDTYNSGNNFFELHNTVLAIDALEFEAATNKSTFQAQQTYSTGLARGNYFDYNLSVVAGASFSSPNAITALGASLDLTLAGNATIPSGARSGLDAYNTINFTGTGTLTQSQGTQIRSYSNLTTGWAFNGSATGTITHLAGLRVLFPDNSGSAVSVTNNYGLLINDQTANTGTITYTNRWGIYQEGASDLNYFAANVLIGSTVNTGDKLQVNGTSKFTDNIFLSAGKYLGYSSTSYITPEDNVQGARITTLGALLLNASTQKFEIAGSEQMRLTSTGLGIGVNNPLGALHVATFGQYSYFASNSASATLSDVQGLQIGWNRSAGNGETILIYNKGAGSNGGLVFANNNGGSYAERMILTDGGNLGIGSTVSTSGGRLVITQDNAVQPAIYLPTDESTIQGPNANTQIRMGGNLALRANGIITNTIGSTEYTRLANTGNFLIGTTTDAGWKFRVNGRTYIDQDVIAGKNLSAQGTFQGFNGAGVFLSYESYGARLESYDYNVSAYQNIFIAPNGGNVAIGTTTSPSDKLLIGGSIRTAAPNTGTAASWKLGSRVAATVVVNTTEYIEVDIGGTLYKLATVT
jgi:hypothetical protein